MSQTESVQIATGTQFSWTASQSVPAQSNAQEADKAVEAVDVKKPRRDKKQRRRSLKKQTDAPAVKSDGKDPSQKRDQPAKKDRAAKDYKSRKPRSPQQNEQKSISQPRDNNQEK